MLNQNPTMSGFVTAINRAVFSMGKNSHDFVGFLEGKAITNGLDFSQFLVFKAGECYRDYSRIEESGQYPPVVPLAALNTLLDEWMELRQMSYPHICAIQTMFVNIVPKFPSWESIYRECGWPDNDGRLPIPSRLQFEVFAASDPIMPLHIVFEDGEFDKAVAALRDETTVRIDFRTGHAGQAFRLNKTTEGLNVEARYWDTQVVNRPLVGDIAEDFICRWEEALPHVQHWFKIVRFVRSVLVDMRMGIEVAA